MKKRNKFLICILIFTQVLFFSCGTKERDKSKQNQEQEKKEQEKKVNGLKTSLINRYSPIILPSKKLRKGKVFTFELEDFLITQDRKLTLFEGNLDDITKNDNHFTAHFTANLIEYATDNYQLFDERKIKFHLRCKYEDFNTLIESQLKHKNQEDDVDFLLRSLMGKPDYFVVCSVTQVNKIAYYAISGYPINSEEAEIKIDFPDMFSVSGELIEMVKFPELTEN